MTTISIADLTDKDVNGGGIFDHLMGSVKAHLHEEFSAQRIRGADYSTVYLGAITSVMQQAVALLLTKEKAGFEADLVAQQVTNATKEFEVLEAQKCKLQAEFDVLVEQRLKVIAETALIAQKKATETAQVSSTSVDVDSVVGRQKALYEAQTKGFKRDAEQKASKIMVDAFNVQRTTDPDVVVGTATNKLDDANIGSVLQAMITGLSA